MATIPQSATDIRILTGVPFQLGYKHTRYFDSVVEQYNYFNAKPKIYSTEDHTYQKIENKFLIKAKMHIDQLWNANYIMFRNADYNNKWFYAFVTKLEYKNVETTYIHFEIDVFQTWLFDINFKPSFVAREHCRLWNEDGTPVVNTVEEGIHYGSEYDNVFTYNWLPSGLVKWLVIVSKTPLENSENKITPTVVGAPQPLSYYIVPFMDNDRTPVVFVEGNNVPVSKPTELLQQLYSAETAVNNIVSLYVTDYTGLPFEYFNIEELGGIGVSFTDDDNEIIDYRITFQDGTENALLKVNKATRFKPRTEKILDNKYQMFNSVKESKLLMFPYAVTILDDFKGNRVVLKNEYISSKEFNLTIKGSLGTSQKISINIPEYNHSVNDGQKLETSNEFALINNNPNDIPILNEYLASYLQGNKNSIMNQVNTIFFNGMLNTLANGVSGASSVATGNVGGLGQSSLGVVSTIGNTQLQLEGIMAKTQDIANTPPAIAKMGNNTAYEIGNRYNGVYVIQKQIKEEYRKKLTDYFNMYGYKLNEVKIPNFHTRQNWNYVQTESCMITGNINNNDLSIMKAIFDNGITLWHTDDIGNYGLENEVI